MRICPSILLLLALARCPVGADTLELQLQGGLPVIASARHPAQRLILSQSDDLVSWQETARVLEQLFPYVDRSAASRPCRFYRACSYPLESIDDWSNQLSPVEGALFTPGSGSGLAATRFAKFSILLDRPDRVYFQNSVKWPYHYHFAKARLPGYGSMTVLEYNAQALYPGPSQRMVVGSVLRAPDPHVREIGIEIVGLEPFPADQVVDWIEAVKKRLVLEPGWRTFYLPTFEQQATAEANRPLFAAHAVPVDSLARWATENAAYSSGWALGRLVYVPGDQVSAALADGRLLFTDILVTDRVPAELPVLAGYLALQPACPNSHVAILAQSLALPFAYANGVGLQAEIASLYSQEVLLVVTETNNNCIITLTDTTALLTPERRQQILDSKHGRPIDITPTQTAGMLSLPADALTPAHVCYVGGKAANFGFLRRSLPHDSPSPAIAFTFDLWNAYLDQTLSGGKTLREFITNRLGHYVYPPNVAVLRNDLAAIRDTVQKTADFNPGQRAAIVAALQQAGLQGRNIRFRSSTNVEDSESYSGAGLYDSYSGCLEDNLDGDNSGPCQCDPSEPEERGVFRAMRKVYASFYNENAFLERLRYSIPEDKVGMALLVHFSSPDADEMANGVATLTMTKTNGQRMASARLVTQLGAASVTNPDPSLRPEIVTATWSGTNTAEAGLSFVESSSLATNGNPVMTWIADYSTLLVQLDTATLAWEQYYPDPSSFELDFEYKRMVPGEIGLKQIRLVPHPPTVPPPAIP